MRAGVNVAPRVTIAVPTLNRPSMLETCLTRLLGQIGSDVEIYVSADGSGPETTAVLDKFVDPRLRKSRNSSTIGLFQNFNRCLAEANGDFIVFLSDDDAMDDDLITSCLALLQRPDAELACTALIAANRYLIIKPDGQRHSHEPLSLIQTGFYEGSFLLEQLWLGAISFQLCGILFCTADLRTIGGFPTSHKYAGDVYAFGALFLNQHVGFLSSPKCTYVLHPKSETTALGMRYRMADLGSVLKHIVATGKRDLQRDQSRSLARSAAWYMATEYIRNTLDLYRAGVSRARCSLAILPSVRWIFRRGGRLKWTVSTFSFQVLFPLKLKEFCWTLQRLWH